MYPTEKYGEREREREREREGGEAKGCVCGEEGVGGDSSCAVCRRFIVINMFAKLSSSKQEQIRANR